MIADNDLESKPPVAKNLLGAPLQGCCMDPKTGYFRDGFCNTNSLDEGSHVICSLMSEDFLVFSKSKGNDLSTPRPEFDFPGLKEGDWWCLCALRWLEAYQEGMAPLLNPKASHEKVLIHIPLEVLEKFYYLEE